MEIGSLLSQCQIRLSSVSGMPSSGQQVKTLDETAGQILSVEFSPDSQLLFISIYTALEVIDKISAWDVNTWQKSGSLDQLF